MAEGHESPGGGGGVGSGGISPGNFFEMNMR